MVGIHIAVVAQGRAHATEDVGARPIFGMFGPGSMCSIDQTTIMLLSDDNSVDVVITEC